MGLAHVGHKVNPKSILAITSTNKGKFGKNHPRWVETKKHPLYKAVREIFKYNEWRNYIFKRDNYSCVLCGITKTYIEADHFPITFSDIFKQSQIESIDDAIKCDKLWDINNGRTLCKPCHLKTDTWGRRPRFKEVMQ